MPEPALRPFIVPVFIPHSGCPHRCTFCDQRCITSEPADPVTPERVRAIVERAVCSKEFERRPRREIGFFGGSFTGLPSDEMGRLLAAAAPYLGPETFQSVRVSTRPDLLDRGRLELLKACGVRTVELGAPSLDDRVLAGVRRGHDAAEVRRAVQRLRAAGLAVGLQLMPGLPGDSAETFERTVEEVIRLGPRMVRLYPALALEGTELGAWCREGKYRPWTLGEAVERCADACVRLEGKGIRVIRLGLQGSGRLAEPGRVLAGPWHPAFGFLVRARIYQREVESRLERADWGARIRLFAAAGEIPLLRGYRNQGLRRLERLTGARVAGIAADPELSAGRIRVERA